MKKESFILIIFSDEVKSTPRDLECRSAKELLQKREIFFGSQIYQMMEDGWEILKNVGDQLVIRFDGDKRPEVVINCLKKLYAAWKEFNKSSKDTQMRIAVHLPCISILATGEDIDKYLKNEIRKKCKVRKLGNLWPSSRYLNKDIFGIDMTFAARIVALPKSGLFVISESVVNESFNSNRFDIKSLDSKAELSFPIPLVHLKGFDNISVDNPVWINEIRNQEKNLRESLYFETKQFQQLRILNLNFGTSRPPKNLQKEISLIMSWFKKGPLNYYVDIALEIEKIWKGYAVDESRNQHRQNRMRFIAEDLNRKAIDRPTAVLFTSAPDGDSILKIRNSLIDKNIKVENGTKTRTYGPKILSREIYGPIFFSSTEFQNLEDKNLFLLLFQAKAEATDPDRPELFESVELGKYIPICYGLLQGDLDGFVLYKVDKKDVSDDEIKSEIINGHKETANHSKFLSNIIPYRLYKLPNILHSVSEKYNDIWKYIGYDKSSAWITNWYEKTNIKIPV